MTIIPLLEVAGLPPKIHSDRAPGIIAGKFGQLLQKYGIQQSTVETNSPWQNQAKGQGVKPIKRLCLWLLQRAGTPHQVWDYVIFSIMCTVLKY